MKLARSLSSILSTYSGRGLRNVWGVSSYSTTATLTSSRKSVNSLYRRLSPVGDSRVSLVPLLDQWIQEGQRVGKGELQRMIKEMRRYNRYKHALEISLWMSDKRYFELSASDVAIRLDLIAKVHGIEQAENYFNNVPKNLLLFGVYNALLNCYARDKSMEKAEAIMQKLRDLGLAKTSLSYNVMLNLYYQTGNHEKLKGLMDEMEEKGIDCDKFTYGIQLSAYAADSDIEAMDKTLTKMETDPKAVLDWTTYSVAANGYLRAGLVDKALAMLKVAEGLISSAKKRSTAFEFLLTQYAATGKKDEVFRLWELYKKNDKIHNRGYVSMLPSILRFDDIEGAEQIFEEWESRKLTYDLRIPNSLIGAYCRKGLLDKAEALLNKIILKGKKPNTLTWYYMATGYLQDNQLLKVVETMKEAILVCRPGWKPDKSTLVACLEYLKGKGDLEEAGEFMRLLKVKEIVPTHIHDRLLSNIKDVKPDSNIFSQMQGYSSVQDGERPIKLWSQSRMAASRRQAGKTC